MAELREQFRVGDRIASGEGVIDGFMCLAEDLDHVGAPRLQAAGTEIGDRATSADDVLAALLDARELREELG